MKKEIQFSILQYVGKVYVVGLIISIVALLIPLWVHYIFPGGFLRLALICFTSVLSVGALVFSIGIDRETRKKITEIIKQRIRG
jgi:hypothetical protein